MTKIHNNNDALIQDKSSLNPPLSPNKVLVSGSTFLAAKHPDDVTLGHKDATCLAWKNVSYQVSDRKKGKIQILKNVTGLVKPGQICAVMGASGAGKSSFLNCVAGRNGKGLTGRIFLNGVPAKDMKHVSTYVMQDDVLLGMLTVRECIEYSADLRFPPSVGKQQRKEKINDIISMLGLARVQNSKIGTPFVRGVSGGERRRTSIAVDIISLPPIIFLDEPTSGLDSASSFNVISSVKKISHQMQRTVMATIHQPNSETFEQFDLLLLLSRGQTIYFGPRQNVAAYYESIGYAIPPMTNPADMVIDLVNTDFYEDRAEADKVIAEFVQHYNDSEMCKNAESEVERCEQKGTSQQEANSLAKLATVRKTYPNNVFVQTFVISHRMFLNNLRNPIAYWSRMAMYIAMALLMGTVWYNISWTDRQIQDRFSAHFFSVAFLCFMSVAGIPAFLEDRLLMMRERANGCYRASAYMFAHTLVTMPFIFLTGFAFTIIAYWMMQLHSGAVHFFRYLLVINLSLYLAESMVVAVSAIIPIFVASLTIVSFLNGLCMVVQGYFVRRDKLPPGWRWCNWLTFEKYTFEALVQNDFVGQSFTCESDITAPNGCSCLFQNYNSSGDPCVLAAVDVLKEYGYEDIKFGLMIVGIVVITFVFRLIFYIALRIRKPGR